LAIKFGFSQGSIIMDEKHQLKQNLCMSDHNIKLNSYHSTLVNNKISKEINNVIVPLEKSTTTSSSDGANSVNGKFVIAKCKGLLGIQFCNNKKEFNVTVYDDVILNITGTFEFANILEVGDMVHLRKYNNDVKLDELPILERIATEVDYQKNVTNTLKSVDAKEIFKKFIAQLSLKMKLVDVHYQFDGKKIFFFYTADGRVDFRELAKKLAGHFKTRIELRQIGVRDEAKMIGGIATCGREFCCASFICSFKKITAEDAYKNNITSSISNYTGPCGKLKCCLAYDI